VAATKENKAAAEREARAIVARVGREARRGRRAQGRRTLVAERLKAHIGPTDKRILQEFTAEFTTRILWDIPPETIVAFADDRQSGNTAESRERFISGLCASSIFRSRRPVSALPAFTRDQKARNPLKRTRRDVQQFRVALLEDIIEASHISIGMQLRVEYAAGARVSSLLQGLLSRRSGHETLTLTFRDTKNGDDVRGAAELDEAGVGSLLEWRQLQVRRGSIGRVRHEKLFLHYKGVPTSRTGRLGTQNKTAFNNAKRRAIKTVGARYDVAIAEMRLAGDVGRSSG